MTCVTQGRRWITCAALPAAAMVLAGCATITTRTAVPIALTDKVEVAGHRHVRYWGDAAIPDIAGLAAERRRQIARTRPHLLKRSGHVTNMIAFSGGGANGAFGAGFMNGWTAAGTRPTFEFVTGVSTGALMAPFVFLGPAYDRPLREIYTLYETRDILAPQVLAGLFGGDSFASSAPLARLIAKYVDRRFLADIRRQHERGRRLLVGTTNLDAQRPVVWDMGAIASQQTPGSLQLFRKVLLASASIPGAFPPVYIDVVSGGQRYQEMHVDGGTTKNAFLLPAHFRIRQIANRNELRRRRKLYVVVNGKTAPSAEPVTETTFAIAGRSISTLIKQQTDGDVLQLYLRSRKNGIGFALANIPVTFTDKSTEPFDRRYMRKLYQVGYRLARNGYRWRTKPPDY